MEIRKEILEIVRAAGEEVLNEIMGPLSSNDIATLIDYLSAPYPEGIAQHAISSLVDELEIGSEIGHIATVKTAGDIRNRSIASGIVEMAESERTPEIRPVTSRWNDAIRTSAETYTKRHFQAATEYFEQGKTLAATEELGSAIVCSIAAVAAGQGWPYGNRFDDDVIWEDAHVRFTGKLPEEGEIIYQLTQNASRQGQDLNSAFTAAIGKPDNIQIPAVKDPDKALSEAMMLAAKAVKLASQLASGNLRLQARWILKGAADGYGKITYSSIRYIRAGDYRWMYSADSTSNTLAAYAIICLERKGLITRIGANTIPCDYTLTPKGYLIADMLSQ